MAIRKRVSAKREQRLNKRKPTTDVDFLTPFESVSLGSNGYFFRDNYLGPQMINRLRSEALRVVSSGVLRPAGVGREGRLDPLTRGDQLCWLDQRAAPEATKYVMATFESLRKSINRQFYLGLDRFEMQLAHYALGSQGYRRHFDAFKGKNERNRRLTAILYLNPRWKPEDGGELVLYLPETEIRLEPVSDRLVVFFSEQIEHEVLAVNSQRLALTAWFHSP